MINDSVQKRNAFKFWHVTLRSSRPEVFCKKDTLQNFVKFTRKYQYRSFFFNKVASLRSVTLLQKRLGHRPCEFCEYFKDTLFYRTPPVAASLFDTLCTNASFLCHCLQVFRSNCCRIHKTIGINGQKQPFADVL